MTVSEALEQLYEAYQDGKHEETDFVFVDKYGDPHKIDYIQVHPEGVFVMAREGV